MLKDLTKNQKELLENLVKSDNDGTFVGPYIDSSAGNLNSILASIGGELEINSINDMDVLAEEGFLSVSLTDSLNKEFYLREKGIKAFLSDYSDKRIIFINYRRTDSEADSGRLYDKLALELGEENVFMDVDDIPPGVDFEAHLTHILENCVAFVCVIGPKWLDILNDRIKNDEKDYVISEIKYAIKEKIRMFPILVRSAKIPKIENIPEEIKELSNINAMIIEHNSFGRDIHDLVEELRKCIKGYNVPSNEKKSIVLDPIFSYKDIERNQDLHTYQLEIEIKNNGEKTINSLKLDYIFPIFNQHYKWNSIREIDQKMKYIEIIDASDNVFYENINGFYYFNIKSEDALFPGESVSISKYLKMIYRFTSDILIHLADIPPIKWKIYSDNSPPNQGFVSFRDLNNF